MDIINRFDKQLDKMQEIAQLSKIESIEMNIILNEVVRMIKDSKPHSEIIQYIDDQIGISK